MMQSDGVSVLAALAYADVFDFPLTLDEITRWSVGSSPSVPEVRNVLRRWLDQPLHAQDVHRVYMFRNRPFLPSLRLRRRQAAMRKWQIAYQAAAVFRYVPTVLLVGVTGGLSMENADADDDIDLFFIVRDGTLWVSRFCVTVLATLFLHRRRPGERQLKNRICLNMFLSQSELQLPPAEQDLFGAHEVLQMRPLWQRQSIYSAFLLANAWVSRLLPNAWRWVRSEAGRLEEDMNIDRGGVISEGFWRGSCVVEPLVRRCQRWYMRSRRTSEVVTATRIRFHPHDSRIRVKMELRKRLAQYNIPLDKIFYGRIK